MGERITCGLLGLIAAEVGGYMAYVGMKIAEPVWRLLVLALLLGALLGVSAATLTALTKVERFLPGVIIFGLILGGLASLVASIGVVALYGIVPYFVVAALLGWLVGWLLCWLCDQRLVLRKDSHFPPQR